MLQADFVDCGSPSSLLSCVRGENLRRELMYGKKSVIEPWALCHHWTKSKISWKLEPNMIILL